MTKISDILETRARLILVSLGLALIVLGNTFDYRLLKVNVAELLAHVGALLLIVGLLHWIFETSMRQQLIRELFDSVVGAGRVSTSGITDFCHNSRSVDYTAMVTSTRRLIIGEHYSSRFFEDYAPQIRERLQHGLETTALLLRPDSDAAQYLRASGSGHGAIKDNLNKIRDLVADTGRGPGAVLGTQLQVKWHSRVLRYSFVLSDDAVWVRFFTNSEGFSLVPAFCVGKATPLYDFFVTDITRLLEQGEDGSI